MGIETDRNSNIDTRSIADIGQLPVIQRAQAPAPAVNDLMKAFREGFITVDDIRRRQTQRPVEESEAALQIQANDFKSRRLNEQETLAPAALALEKHRLSLAERKMAADEKDLNANEDTRLARESYEKTKAQHAADLVSADPKVRKEAVERERGYDLEKVYAGAFGSVPESFTLDEAAPVDDFQTWIDKNIPAKVEQAEKEFLASYPQATPDTILQFREDVKDEALKSAATDYKQYVATRGTKKHVVQQGTPEYYKELQNQLTLKLNETKTKEAQFGAYAEGLKTQAKTAAERPGKTIESAAKLRNEVEQSKPIQNFRLQQQAAELVTTFATIPQPTNRTDLQLIYAAVKMADPGSVVREGEIALSRQADPVLVSMKKRLEGITSRSGKLLDDADRKELARISATVLDRAKASVRPEFEKFGRLAQDQGIPLADVLNPVEASILTGTAAAAPAAGVASNYEELLGKTVTVKDPKSGQLRTGVVIRNADGTYSLK